MNFKLWAFMFFAAVTAANLAGCGALDSKQAGGASGRDSNAVSQIVVERAQQRWNALLKRDSDGAYQFISPAGRSVMTMENYRPRVNSGFWRGAKVKEASCAVETCEVTVLVDLFVEGVKFTNPVKETWILEAGKWWFVYQG